MRYRSHHEHMKPLERWHPHYALRPVIVNDDVRGAKVWLEHVERRCYLWGDGYGPPLYEYRLIPRHQRALQAYSKSAAIVLAIGAAGTLALGAALLAQALR